MSAVLPSATVDPKPARRDAATPLPTTMRDLPNSVVEATEAVAKVLPAEERLALSRAGLRTAMLDIAHPPPKPSVLGPRASGLLQEAIDKVRDLPGSAIVMESVERWWKDHPLRTAGVVASHASSTLVKPIVERNPQGFLLGAVGLGALFMLTKPWRWLLRPALFMGLLPQLVSQALKHMPLDALIRMATASLGSKKRSPFPAKPLRSTSAGIPPTRF